MRDILRDGMFAAHGTGIDGIRLAGFAEGVVAAVEILALFEVLGEMVGSGGELAVEAEEAGFFGGEGLWISLLGLRVWWEGMGAGRKGGRCWGWGWVAD